MNALIETINHWAENLFVAASRQSAANIETLNRWGENFLNFAWPMLWQSSLLIAIVFALDCLLARKIRAAVRHALWIVVLVKLLLPPALALPTGAAWWLWRPKPAPIIPVVNNYTVSFDQTPTSIPDIFVPPAAPIALPPSQLSGAGWTMLASAAISAGLLLWLLFCWRRVAAKVRCAPISDAFASTLEEARQLARPRWSVRFSVSGRIRLKLVDDNQSPALYGLFRPVILLPRALTEKLSVRQLRAVLLHEAIHLRRGDVWVNCAQALLQIAYWWHPLLWFANARIRRVREEAVDDAVMLALRGDADAYAPTLLEVARFAFRRPLASLGLIGILESRSALRQRVERLVDFHPPRKAGLTFLSLCGIFTFSAVALPMGPASVSENDLTLSRASDATTNSQASVRASVLAALISNDLEMRTSLEMRTFKVNPNTFYVNLQNKLRFFPFGPAHLHTTRAGVLYVTTQNLTRDVSALAAQFFSSLGVNLNPPKALFYHDRSGVLFVYATPHDLDIIARAIQALNNEPPQIHIKARFLEVPKSFFATGNSLLAGVTNGVILTNPDFQVFLHEAQMQKGMEELAEPEVTTLSGRHTVMRATVTQPVIVNYMFETNSTNPGSIVPQIDKVETGPILDVVPRVLANGSTIDLRTEPSLIKFFGYADARGLSGRFATNAAGEKIALPVSLPAFQVSSSSMQKILPDGQTLVLFPKPEDVSPGVSAGSPDRDAHIAKFIQKAEKIEQNKVLIVLVTATLIDSAGNRINQQNASLTEQQAASLATRLANNKASLFYHRQPFRDNVPAQFEAGHWVWTALQGYGHDDVQATVCLAADGSTNSVHLQWLDNQNGGPFIPYRGTVP